MDRRRIVRSRRTVLPDDTLPADILVEGGVIKDIGKFGDFTDGEVHDAGDRCILPGLVDIHVHLNEPGRTTWEGFLSGTAAARAGGVTTLIDMPLNSSPVTTTLDALKQKRQAAIGKLHVDVGLHAGIVPQSASVIGTLIDEGARAAKVFLCHSGIDEFPETGETDLRMAMKALAQRGATLLAHAELVHPVDDMTSPTSYKQYVTSRPPSFERKAIELLIDLMEQTGCAVHIVHLADAGSLPTIQEARDKNLPLTVETCPHYLFFSEEQIPDGGTQFKCAPPIRDAANRDALWQGLRDGLIDMIVSDHSPCPVEMKRLESGRFDEAWGGISSLQLGLPIIWTEASRRNISLEQVIRWMSVEPGNLLNLPNGIEVGKPAHLVEFDPEHTWTVDQTTLLHRNPITPYHAIELRGAVCKTFVHGEPDAKLRGRLI